MTNARPLTLLLGVSVISMTMLTSCAHSNLQDAAESTPEAEANTAAATAAPEAAEAADAAKPAAKKLKVVEMRLSGAMPEIKGGFSLFEEEAVTFSDVLATIRKAGTDESVHSMIVKLDGPAVGSAQMTELRRAFLDFRKSGKPLTMTMEGGGLGAYYLASTGTEIVMPEIGGLDLMGMNIGLMYFKDALAKIGVQGQVVNTGKFKDAFDPFTKNEMGEGTKIQMTAIMEDLFGTMASEIAESRNISADKAKELLTGGLYTTQMAKEAGLVDRIAYYSDLKAGISAPEGFELEFVDDYSHKEKKKKEPLNIFALFSGGAKGGKKASAKGDKIAIVYASGPISDGYADKSNPFGSSAQITSGDFIDLLNDVAEEPGLKGIVLRVDSPGGSAVASDLIWKRLEEIQASGVPIVASMGNVAASGGYYISMGCDKILAEPTTITGSIGVFGGRFILGGTYEKLGIKKQNLTLGKWATINDESKPWNDEEIAMINKSIDQVYETFTSKAADGRGTTQARIKELGGGRVWSGVAAKENGLVDELGGIDRAVEIAKELAKTPNASVVTFPKEKDITEIINEILSGGASVSARSVTMAAISPNGLHPALAPLELFVPVEHLQHLNFMLNAMKDRPAIMMALPGHIEIEY